MYDTLQYTCQIMFYTHWCLKIKIFSHSMQKLLHVLLAILKIMFCKRTVYTKYAIKLDLGQAGKKNQRNFENFCIFSSEKVILHFWTLSYQLFYFFVFKSVRVWPKNWIFTYYLLKLHLHCQMKIKKPLVHFDRKWM